MDQKGIEQELQDNNVIRMLETIIRNINAGYVKSVAMEVKPAENGTELHFVYRGNLKLY